MLLQEKETKINTSDEMKKLSISSEPKSADIIPIHLKWIREWGGSSSEAVLNPLCKHFIIPNLEGLISYRIEYNCAVIFGDPICPTENLFQLTSSFHQFANKNFKNIIYIGASEAFTQWALEKQLCKVSIEICEEVYMDPFNDPTARQGVNASLVRRKSRHAKKEGVSVKEYIPLENEESAHLEKKLNEIGEAWLKSRKGPQIYISGIRLFENRYGKRWFYATKGDQCIGVLVLNMLKAKNGWLMNHVMVVPDAPGGTPELLVVTALDAIRNEGSHFVTFGSIPGVKLGAIKGMGKIGEFVSKIGFNISRKLFRLEGRMKFWEKFHPEVCNSYLLLSKPKMGVREVGALMSAMNVSVSY